MPWSNNSGGSNTQGPWGGGGRGSSGGGGGGGGPWGGNGRGGGGGAGGGGQGPNIDDFFKKGQKQLKTVFGDGGGGAGGIGLLALLLLAGLWIYASVYTVKPEEEAMVLTFGQYTRIDPPGLNFAPWPVQTAEIRAVTRENTTEVGTRRGGGSSSAGFGRRGVMLTGDENIIDINFQVIWTIKDLKAHLLNLADPESTITAVAESAMREVVGRSELLPLLNRDRAVLAADVRAIIQATLDEYEAGVAIRRVNLDRADPPQEVIDDFRDVQAAEQERERSVNEARFEANRITAEARGEAGKILQDANAYAARVVAEAEGEAARFLAVLTEYKSAPDVTRRRLYIETMEKVFGGMNKIILDEKQGVGQGVVPYLPLDQLGRGRRTAAAGAPSSP